MAVIKSTKGKEQDELLDRMGLGIPKPTQRLEEHQLVKFDKNGSLTFDIHDIPGFNEEIEEREEWINNLVNDLSKRFEKFSKDKNESPNELNSKQLAELDKRIHVCLFFISNQPELFKFELMCMKRL